MAVGVTFDYTDNTDILVATGSSQQSAIVGDGFQIDFDKNSSADAIQVLLGSRPAPVPVVAMVLAIADNAVQTTAVRVD